MKGILFSLYLLSLVILGASVRLRTKMSITQKTDALSVLKNLESMIRSQKEGEGGENSPLESALKGLQSIIPKKY